MRLLIFTLIFLNFSLQQHTIIILFVLNTVNKTYPLLSFIAKRIDLVIINIPR
jgi:hypothetical protein